MKLDYGTALSFKPITLSVGTIRKPTLNDIAELTFPVFDFFQVIVSLNPKRYYKKTAITLGYEKSTELWDNMSTEEQNQMSMFDIVLRNDKVKKSYLDVLNFFFVDTVIFQNDYFFVIKDYNKSKPIIKEDIQGIFGRDYFDEIINIIGQICCVVDNNKEKESDQKFKNEKAREIWRKMHPEEKEEENDKKKKSDINLTIPNVISSVAANSLNLNIVNIWDITLFQLYDQFNKVVSNKSNYIHGISVSVWGDEKKQFDMTGWNKNLYDKSN